MLSSIDWTGDGRSIVAADRDDAASPTVNGPTTGSAH